MKNLNLTDTLIISEDLTAERVKIPQWKESQERRPS
jgi:hypothetical protein